MLTSHKLWLLVVMLISTTVVLAGSPQEDLMNRFQAAYASKDANALVDLVYPKGLTDEIRSDLHRGFQFNFDMKLKLSSIKISPFPEGMPSERNINGVIFRLNLKPVGRLEAELSLVDESGNDLGSTNAYPIGEHESRLYIITGVPSKN